jgi:hypothetical protein
MNINLTDPQSIAAWFRVAPARHGPMLRHWLKAWPEFAPGIEAARELIPPRQAAAPSPCTAASHAMSSRRPSPGARQAAGAGE